MTTTNPSSGSSAPSDVPRAVGRVLDLLEIVLAAGTCNLTAAATASALTPTTALRHLRALEARGYLERDRSGAYSVGPTMLRLSAALGETGPVERLVALTQPHLDALAVETGESAYLALSDGRVATYVATAESSRAIRHVGWIGQSVTLDGTAIGEALRAPGRCFTRTGAVEPDITATSMALPAGDSVGVALSIIGPAHRCVEPMRTEHTRALTRVVDGLTARLGTDAAEAS